jgi:hypothetical protein
LGPFTAYPELLGPATAIPFVFENEFPPFMVAVCPILDPNDFLDWVAMGSIVLEKTP